MNQNSSLISDKAAIGVSALCVLHCLITPVLLTSMPTIMANYLEGEAFHITLVFLVIPLSLYALYLGCKQHNRYQFLGLGIIGIAFLITAIFFGHDLFGPSFPHGTGEKVLTVIGSVLITIAHVLNFRLCKKTQKNSCECAD